MRIARCSSAASAVSGFHGVANPSTESALMLLGDGMPCRELALKFLLKVSVPRATHGHHIRAPWLPMAACEQRRN